MAALTIPIEDMIDQLDMRWNELNQARDEPITFNELLTIRFLNDAQDEVIKKLKIEKLHLLETSVKSKALNSSGNYDLASITGSSYTTTAASGSGTVATISFATQTSAPFALGSTITVAGVTPTGYNQVNAVVTACTTGSVSYANVTTGNQSVAGTVGGTSTVLSVWGKYSGIKSVKITGEKYCDIITIDDYISYVNSDYTFTESSPKAYIYADSVHVEPNSGAQTNIDINYLKEPTPLSVDTTTPASNVDCAFDISVQRAIMEMAASYGYAYGNDYVRAEKSEQKALRLIDDINGYEVEEKENA